MPVITRSQKQNSDIAATALKAKTTTYRSMYSGTPVPPFKPSIPPQLEDPKVNTDSKYKREFGDFSSHADFLSWAKNEQPVLKKTKKQSSSEPFRLRTF